jgi:hypothetical protein
MIVAHTAEVVDMIVIMIDMVAVEAVTAATVVGITRTVIVITDLVSATIGIMEEDAVDTIGIMTEIGIVDVVRDPEADQDRPEETANTATVTMIDGEIDHLHHLVYALQFPLLRCLNSHICHSER